MQCLGRPEEDMGALDLELKIDENVAGWRKGNIEASREMQLTTTTPPALAAMWWV